MNRSPMTGTASTAADAAWAYTRDTVLTASPQKLLTLLYDRLLVDLHRAETAQQSQSWAQAGEQLVHAQQILSELRSSLTHGQWNGSRELEALYVYVTGELIQANTSRDVARTQECIAILEPLRQTWHEAAQTAELATQRGTALQPAAPSLPQVSRAAGRSFATQPAPSAAESGGLLGVG